MRRPRPIHGRAETIDSKEPFRIPFHGGQRGIVVFRTFNEGEEVVKPSGRTETRQWTIDPRDGQPRGFAFVWNRFTIPDLHEDDHIGTVRLDSGNAPIGSHVAEHANV